MEKWEPPVEGCWKIQPWGVFFKKLDSDAKLPEYKTEGSSGADLFSAENANIPAGTWRLINCGFSMEMPKGVEAQIRPRSGLAAKHGITVLNAPGTIDSDYRGRVKVILINHSDKAYRIEVGDRIAQMVLAWVPRVSLFETVELSETERGEGGFGSTGKR